MSIVNMYLCCVFRPPATLINFMQKKKKKTGSDGSDLDVTPPPSPHAAEEIDSTVVS